MKVRNNLPTLQLLKRLKSLRRLRSLQDQTSLTVLGLAAIIGTVTGLIGVIFQFAVNLAIKQRQQLVSSLLTNPWLYWFGAFIISAIMAAVGYYLVKRFAPEAGGSGIPEIEGALVDLRPVRWRRVLPVKFIGGIGTLGSGMVLGREGPTVQLGGNLGRMIAELFGVRGNDNLHTLLATGAAAGLTAAFNAPLAGILFIIEEMRPQFRYNLISIKAVFVGVIMASVVYHLVIGQNSVFRIGQFAPAAVETLWLYLLLGIVFGGVGVMFNRGILKAQVLFQRFYQRKHYYFVLTGALIGGAFGLISLWLPEASGGGFAFIPDAVLGRYSLAMLSMIFLLRVMTTIFCFSSGAPGGIFAPTLALGTILGMIFGMLAQYYLPNYALELGAFAIAGMGALFAATVRAPLTGIVLVMEMTDNYQLILPMIITCFGATLIAQALGGRPLYSVLLERTLLRTKAQELQQSVTTSPKQH